MGGEAGGIVLSASQRKHFAWLSDSSAQAVVTALDEFSPRSVRFVGGCVRDSLFGRTPKDFDLATQLQPDEVITALTDAGIAYAPTGIDHGTVTAIVDHRGFEITSLRADVATDGRRAVVAFTDDWKVDAERRDFTINAIFCTPNGLLFDPVNGLKDVAARRVRFIGNPTERIREDYLRILRFYRFSARFADNFDEAGLAACQALSAKIKSLSRERVGSEMMMILSLPRPHLAIHAMIESGVLSQIWHAPPDLKALERLSLVSADQNPALLLGILFDDEASDPGGQLRLSNAQRAIRSSVIENGPLIQSTMDDKAIRAAIYRLGKPGFCDAVNFGFAKGRIRGNERSAFLKFADDWSPPLFPVRGKDVLDLGVEKGHRVGEILARTESMWVDEDFPGPERIKTLLARFVTEV